MRRDTFETEASVRRVIAAFENQTISGQQWSHELRLTVTMWYLLIYDEADATARQIARTRALARCYGNPREGPFSYNETLTLFWMAIARQFISSLKSSPDRLSVINRFLAAYRTHEALILEYYTPHTLHSLTARWSWVEPDLKPLPSTLPESGVRGSSNVNSNGPLGRQTVER